MTKLLEEAFKAASQLVPEQQDALARKILQELASDRLQAEAIAVSEEGEYPNPNLSAYMARQAESFNRMKPHLLERYREMFVLFENGQVIDADESEEALVLRAFSETGPRALFVKKVVAEEPELRIGGFSRSHSPLLSIDRDGVD